ncbi:MAG: AMP-binding protein, partial [Bacillota bacterium]
MGLVSLARKNSQRYVNKIAFIDGGKYISFNKFYADILKAITILKKYGIAPGDRFTILAENCVEIITFLFAAAGIGSIMVPLNFRLARQELLYIIRNCSPLLFFYHEPTKHMAISLKEEVVMLRQIEEWRDEPGVTYRDHFFKQFVSTGPCLLIYSSGSTGYPKGCQLSEQNLVANAVNLAFEAGINDRDIYLSFAPLFHVAGLNLILATFLAGATTVILPRFNPEAVAESIVREKATFTFFITPTLRRFVNAPAIKREHLKSLRLVFGPGGKEPPEVLRAAFNLLSPKFLGIYGQTEAAGVVSLSTEQIELEKPGSCGQLLPLYAGRIVDEEGWDLPDGANGELILKGPGVFQGYWNDVAQTEKTLVNGWLHTGDIFRRDEMGNLYLVDRKKYLIKTGGENVYPKEVEKVLLEHPLIADAAVVGVPDEQWGEAVKAFLVVREGAQKPAFSEIEQWVKERIAG